MKSRIFIKFKGVKKIKLLTNNSYICYNTNNLLEIIVNDQRSYKAKENL